MTIVLRLQGLDVKAGAEDIRSFFEGLHIPDGGVYIVGGSLREAFIAFTTRSDAKCAMGYTENTLKGSKVTLHISSMAELEKKLKKSLLKRKKRSSTQLSVKRPKPQDVKEPPVNTCVQNQDIANLPNPLSPYLENLQPATPQSLDSNTAFLLGICTVLQGLQASFQSENQRAVPGEDTPKADGTVVVDEVLKPKQTLDSKPGYVRLFGIPASTTKQDICHFFKGLTVEEAIVNVELGHGRGCLVKFANMQDASDALLLNQCPMGSFFVEVRAATEKMWSGVLQECETDSDDVKPKQTPLRATADHKQNTTLLQRQSINRASTKFPKISRHDSDSKMSISPNMEYIVMVRHLPNYITKTELKELFGCPNIAHSNIQHLLDKDGTRTDTAFLIFNANEDYEYAMNLTGCHLGSDTIKVSSVTEKRMRDIMAKNKMSFNRHPQTPLLSKEPRSDPRRSTKRGRGPMAYNKTFVQKRN